jgi:hypothetical protein
MMLSLSLHEFVNPGGLVGLWYHYIHTKFCANVSAERLSLALCNALSLSHTHTQNTYIYMHVGQEPSFYVVAALVLFWASDYVQNVATEKGIVCSRKDVSRYTHEVVFLHLLNAVVQYISTATTSSDQECRGL